MKSLTMRLITSHSSRLAYKIINSNFIKDSLRRHASVGVGLWEEDINTEAKLKVEDYWRDKVNKRNNEAESLKEKFYVLAMFPYPSGMLHMGHVRVYTISDCIARYYRMKGKYVIHPIGWDAFGLPAENAAREQQVEPDKWTTYNIEKMREQLHTLGCSFDWECELTTCDPEYYKWTQELFLKLFEKNLICRRQDFVNWDPIDQTVLAEEQVDENNKSWRSGANVEKKLLNQWFIKATVFYKSLLEGLDDPILENWRDIIKVQKHWIGECNGTNFEFELISDTLNYPKTLILWTDKAEFIEEAKFVAISADSVLAKIEESNGENIKKLNAKIINPFTKEELPIFVTSTIEFPPFRDNHLGIPCASDADAKFCNAVGITFEPENVLFNSNRQHKQLEILEKAKKWNIGGYPVSSKSRDWLISRQRSWGTPIPIIHCKACGVQPVPRDQLPVILPKINRSSTGHYSTLLEATEWLKTECPNCGGQATRETDTMDTFVDSSWYFMRFIDSKNKREMFAKNKANDTLPVDLYIGGKEHGALGIT